MQCMPMNEWLEYINEYVAMRDGQVVKKSDLELRGQELLFPTSKFVASEVKPVDQMIQGFCGVLNGLDLINDGKSRTEFPMGKAMVYEGEPDKSWLHAVIEESGATSVAIFAECCGDYAANYKQMLRDLFPNVTFHFLPVHDLFDNVHHRIDEVVKAALKAGVVQISK